jgi:hypothetical protein
VLRLLDRSLGHDVLRPVDRAFVAGAKATLEQLAIECENLLKSKPYRPYAGQAPSSAPAPSKSESSAVTPSTPSPAKPTKYKKKPKAKTKDQTEEPKKPAADQGQAPGA